MPIIKQTQPFGLPSFSYNAPEEGQVFKGAGNDENIYKRVGGKIQAIKRVKVPGIDFASLPTFNLADLRNLYPDITEASIFGGTAADYFPTPTTPTAPITLGAEKASEKLPPGVATPYAPTPTPGALRPTPPPGATDITGDVFAPPPGTPPSTPAPIPGQQTEAQRAAAYAAAGAGTPPPLATSASPEVQAMDTQRNQQMQVNFQTIDNQLTTTTDLSKFHEQVISLLSETEKPTAPSQVETGKQYLADLNVGTLEGDLSANDVKRAQLEASWAATEAEEGGRLVSMTQIRKRQSALGIEYTRQKGELEVERTRIVSQLNMKYNTVNMMMNWQNQDYQTANQQYQQKISNAISLTNLIRGISEDQQTAQDKAKNTAVANAGIYVDMIKAGWKPSANDDLSIKNAELQAGLPLGYTKLMASQSTGKEIKTSWLKDDGTGVITLFADGSTAVVNFPSGTTAKVSVISQATLNKLAIAGVPAEVANGIQQEISAGYTLEEIRQNLAKQFGRETGYPYLDRFMEIMQKGGEESV